MRGQVGDAQAASIDRRGGRAPIAHHQSPEHMKQITPVQLKAWLDDPAREPPVLLDVREPWEVAICGIPGSVHMPMQTVPARLAELDPERDVVVVCHHGHRSFQVAMFMERNGFAAVHNLFGGVDGWAKQVDSAMALY